MVRGASAGNLNIDTIISTFEHYMQHDNANVSRAEFEKNLLNKKKDMVFNGDIQPLLSVDQVKQYQSEQAYDIALKQFLVKLRGESWQGES